MIAKHSIVYVHYQKKRGMSDINSINNPPTILHVQILKHGLISTRHWNVTLVVRNTHTTTTTITTHRCFIVSSNYVTNALRIVSFGYYCHINLFLVLFYFSCFFVCSQITAGPKQSRRGLCSGVTPTLAEATCRGTGGTWSGYKRSGEKAMGCAHSAQGLWGAVAVKAGWAERDTARSCL